MVDVAVVGSVHRYPRTLREYGLNVRFGIRFGSWVAGTPDQWSNIDLLVVSLRVDPPVTRRDVDLLWRVAAAGDNRIEAVPCEEEQYETDPTSEIVEIGRRKGASVALGEGSELPSTP